jgi:hypothetical protein
MLYLLSLSLCLSVCLSCCALRVSHHLLFLIHRTANAKFAGQTAIDGVRVNAWLGTDYATVCAWLFLLLLFDSSVLSVT